MASFIQYAVPTDEEAIDHLKNLGQSVKITAEEAKRLYPDYITHYKNFECPYCSAPISCRAIYPYSRTGPAFVDQSYKSADHANDCRYHPDNREDKVSDSSNDESTSEHISSGEYITDLTRKGFPGSAEPPYKKTAPTGREIPDGNYNHTTGAGKQKNKRIDKEITHHLSTLESHVRLYLENEEFEIIINETGTKIPLKYMFRKIQDNQTVEGRKAHKYLNIYWGYAFINETSNEDIWSIRFADKMTVEGVEGRPSFAVKNEYMKENFQDIYEAFQNGDKNRFLVYTTLPFILKNVGNKTYINFASFESGEAVKPWADELFNNFYIV